jgi:hypothetical protein
MGFLDFLFGKTKCPSCSASGARASEGRVRCPNPSCENFDGTLRRGRRPPRRTDYTPAQPLSIRYRNFQGQDKSFTADAGSLQRKRNHIVVRVVPTGEKIALSRDRIRNLAEVEGAMPQQGEAAQPRPTAREWRVLAFHRKHKSTSPLYEQIRAKYPDS